MLDRETRRRKRRRSSTQVLQRLGDDHEARYNLGVCLARQGRFEEALASYDRAIALKPDFAEAHSGRGLALGRLGRHEAALESHARSIELDPGSCGLAGRASAGARRAARSTSGRSDAAALERGGARLPCRPQRRLPGSRHGSPGRSCTASSSGWGSISRHPRSTFCACSRRSRKRCTSFCNDRLLLAALEKITDRRPRHRGAFHRHARGSAAAGGRATLPAGAAGSVRTARDRPCAAVLPQRVSCGTSPKPSRHSLVELERQVEDATRHRRLSSSARSGIVACYGPLAEAGEARAMVPRTSAGPDRYRVWRRW